MQPVFRRCATCPTLLEHHVRADARYCRRCRKREEKRRAAARGAAYVLTDAKRTRDAKHHAPTLDLRCAHVSATVADQDTGRYLASLRSTPCAYCGSTADTLDHITPRARGGGNTWDNLTAACRSCNIAKSDMNLIAYLDVRRDAAALRRLLSRRESMRLIGVGGNP